MEAMGRTLDNTRRWSVRDSTPSRGLSRDQATVEMMANLMLMAGHGTGEVGDDTKDRWSVVQLKVDWKCECPTLSHVFLGEASSA